MTGPLPPPSPRVWRTGWRAILAIAACLLALASPPAPAQTETLRGGLQVDNLCTPFSHFWGYGSGELRYRFTNISSNAYPKIELAYPGSTYSSSKLQKMSRKLSLEPGESRVVTLPVPALAFWGNNNIRVSYAGKSRYIDAPQRNFRPSPTWGGGPSSKATAMQASVLVGHSLNHRDLQTAISKAMGSGQEEGIVKHELGMSDWSPNWLAYGHYDAVVLSETDYQNLPAPAREALHRYTEMGGCLTLLGQTRLPPHWKPAASGTYIEAGLGRVIQLKGSQIKDVPTPQWRAACVDHWLTRREANRPAEFSAIQACGRVVDDLSVPVLPLFLLMLIFAIVIGPLNLWYLNKRKKRIWMLWTVPAISAVTCGLVFLFSLISEGVRPSRSTASYSLLDQSTGHAATLGVVGFYSPLTPSKGFHFDYDTEVLPVTSSSTKGEIVYGTDQHYRRGWALARVPVYFQLRRAETTKLRLQIKRAEATGAEVVNGFGLPIAHLWLADSEGNIHEGTNIPAGAKASLKPNGRIPSKPEPAFSLRTLNEISHQVEQAQNLATFANRKLRPNEYFAVIEAGNPMLPTVLEAKRKRDRAVIHGRFTPPGGTP